MEQRVMEKKDVKSFIAELIKLYPAVYGPVAKGKSVVFDRLKDAGEAKFSYTRSILPPKKYLMPQQECISSKVFMPGLILSTPLTKGTCSVSRNGGTDINRATGIGTFWSLTVLYFCITFRRAQYFSVGKPYSLIGAS